MSGKAKQSDIMVTDQKIKLMQIYLDHMTSQNEELKQKLEDMRMTAEQNKSILRDFLINVTNKDQAVERLQWMIENLQERVRAQDEYIKKCLPQAKNQTQIGKFEIKSPEFRGKNHLDEGDQKVTDLKEIQPKKAFLTSRASNLENEHSNLKDFFNKQKLINDELQSLKKDMQFIFDNLDYFKKKKCQCEDKENSFDSDLSDNSTNKSKKNKFQMTKGFQNKIEKILEDFDSKENVILFTDNKNNIWEIVRRDDLTKENLSNGEIFASSVNKQIDDRMIDINYQSQAPQDNNSLNDSQVTIDKNNEFNIENLMHEGVYIKSEMNL